MISNHRNAVILAAGTSSRFVPLSAERPKGLLEVKGDILIERQICQLKEAGIENISIVVGYKAEMFSYLRDKFGVHLVMNEDYERYNNTSSIVRVLDRLHDTFICSSDNYFPKNVFLDEPEQSYYSALFAEGKTSEYCLETNDLDEIINVTIGGQNSWYMIGHVYFSSDFSNAFKRVMAEEYNSEATKLGYWEDVYIKHMKELPKMLMHKYNIHDIEEFDSIDELRQFDGSYINNTRSAVLKNIAERLACKESAMHDFRRVKHVGDYILFTFKVGDSVYQYNGDSKTLTES